MLIKSVNFAYPSGYTAELLGVKDTGGYYIAVKTVAHDITEPYDKIVYSSRLDAHIAAVKIKGTWCPHYSRWNG